MSEATAAPDLPQLQDYRSLFQLAGARAIVIGGASGIGLSSARALAAFGAEVRVADVNAEAADRAAAEIRDMGGEASASAVDITVAASIDELFRAFGEFDVLVSSPAINVRKQVLDLTDDEFDRVIDVNLKGYFRVLKRAGQSMVSHGGGSIVVFSSIRSQVVEPCQGPYAATKAGVLQLCRVLAAELGSKGVRVNAIAPGIVETPLTAEICADRQWYDAYANKSILRRWARPNELAGAVVFLASRASSYVTGSCLVVDGGWLAADGRFDPPGYTA